MSRHIPYCVFIGIRLNLIVGHRLMRDILTEVIPVPVIYVVPLIRRKPGTSQTCNKQHPHIQIIVC